MVGIIVTAHGDLADALLRSAEMIIGPQDRAVAVALRPNDSPEAIVDKLALACNEVGGPEGVLVLTDLFGGSPANAVATLFDKHPNLEAVTGVNLPMLLEVLAARSTEGARALAELAVATGAKSLHDLGALLREDS